MAKGPKITKPTIPASLPHDQGIFLLEKQLEAGKQLLGEDALAEDRYGSWETVTRNYLTKVFGSDSPNVSAVMDVGKYGAFPMNAGASWWEKHRRKSLQTQITELSGLVEMIKTELSLEKTPKAIPEYQPSHSKKVFLVHGRNEAVLHGVARFLEKLGLDVTILREQPNEGKTIIEKFAEFSDVGFAIVLLTADDRGGLANDTFEQQRPRARQNVILELGYFLGKIGRKRVCALYQSGVEIPSDYQGVLFVGLDDAGAWKLSLAKELKACGIDVDMNKAL
jgi:predicted nucleotide-binding protein